MVVMPATLRLGELMGRIRNSRSSLGTSDVKASLGYVSLGLKKKSQRRNTARILWHSKNHWLITLSSIFQNSYYRGFRMLPKQDICLRQEIC